MSNSASLTATTRVFLVIVLAAGGSLFAGCVRTTVNFGPTAAGFSNKRIAVLDVTKPGKGGLDWTLLLAGVITEYRNGRMIQAIESELMELGWYTLINRAQLEMLMAEHDFQMTSVIDARTAVKFGKISGLDGVVLVEPLPHRGGWVFPLSYGRQTVVAKLVDVKTGAIVWSARSRYDHCTILPFILFWLNPVEAMAEGIRENLANKLKSQAPGNLHSAFGG